MLSNFLVVLSTYHQYKTASRYGSGLTTRPNAYLTLTLLYNLLLKHNNCNNDNNVNDNDIDDI